ncbi:MAG: tetratricopeptide repeat protein [Tenuifilaceae bacterium]
MAILSTFIGISREYFMLNLHKRFLLIFTLLVGTLSLSAQESSLYTNFDVSYRKGLELFEKGKFGDAQKIFEKVSSSMEPGASQLKSDAEFYKAMCAIELSNNDAEYLIGTFINSYPESQKVNIAFLEMGRLRYNQKDYKEALSWFQKIDRKAFSQEKKADLQFMIGYSHFNLNDYESASRAFFEIKDTDNKYSSPATYYYSHIAYNQKKYATALKGFEKLTKDETFATVAPFYITQIYYLQRQYDKVVEYAPSTLETASAKRAPEIARLIGDSYYRLKQYDKAVPFMEQYQQKTTNITRDDYYLIGFINYKNQNFAEAAKNLEKVSTEEDSLSQNANYHLADCYIKLNDKNKARQAFSMASKANFDPQIKEDALFNFAKITYELLYSPFNEAVDAFRKYIELYPNTPRTDEAYNFLVLAYMNTRNYQEALESLDKIKNQDASIKRAYQRVAFFRGLELFQNLNYTEAVKKFDLSLKFPEFNRTILAQTLYWQGESYFKLENYTKAAETYNQFLLSPGAFGLPEYKLAHYNLGYSYFKQKNYDDAIVWFRKYTNICQNEKTQFVGDAFNRIGDSYFIQRKYWTAIDYYDKAITTNAIDADYATFQRGFSLGLVDRPQKEIETLLKLLTSFPESNFVDDAIFEIAESNQNLKQYDEAVKYHKMIEKDFSGSSYHVKSLVQLGLIYFNQDKPDSSSIYYKRVVEEYPGTQEAKNALIGIKNIYVDKGEVDAYFAYAAQLGNFANISLAEKDSLSYIGAEKLYMSGDCEKSKPALRKYIEDYPKGSFVLSANFYLGDCYNQSGNKDEALEAFNQVVQRQKNDFTEQALLSIAQINYEKGDFANAYESYDKLENIAEVKNNLLIARVGKLRSASNQNLNEDVITAANIVLQTEKLPLEIERETRFKLAQSYMQSNKLDEAFDEYAKVASDLKTIEGAESKFHLAEILYQKNDLDKAEAEIFNFSEKNTPHNYWLAKSFILLSDVYSKKNDFFQAKATLQSVIDGYSVIDDGILDEATTKLNTLVKTEKGKQTTEPQDTMKIKVKKSKHFTTF